MVEEYIMRYDIDDNGKMINARRKEKVIRCGKCNHSDWYTSADGNRYCYCMEHDSSGHRENDFCSYAEEESEEEKRDENQNYLIGVEPHTCLTCKYRDTKMHDEPCVNCVPNTMGSSTFAFKEWDKWERGKFAN